MDARIECSECYLNLLKNPSRAGAQNLALTNQLLAVRFDLTAAVVDALAVRSPDTRLALPNLRRLRLPGDGCDNNHRNRNNQRPHHDGDGGVVLFDQFFLK